MSTVGEKRFFAFYFAFFYTTSILVYTLFSISNSTLHDAVFPAICLDMVGR